MTESVIRNEDQQKTELVERLRSARNKFIQAIEGVSYWRWNEPLDGWSLKDIVAHIVEWDLDALRRAKDFIDGKDVNFGSDEDNYGFNKKAVLRWKSESPRYLDFCLRKTTVEFFTFLYSCSSKKLFMDRQISFQGQNVTPAWFFDEPEHDIDHVAQITAWREKNGL